MEKLRIYCLIGKRVSKENKKRKVYTSVVSKDMLSSISYVKETLSNSHHKNGKIYHIYLFIKISHGFVYFFKTVINLEGRPEFVVS